MIFIAGLLALAIDGGDSSTEVVAGEDGGWTTVSASPLSPRAGHSAVFTGTEHVVWGGQDESSTLADGAAYDPATDSWRTLPESPLADRSHHAAVWTGSEMLVWGGSWSTRSPAGADPDPNCIVGGVQGEPLQQRCSGARFDGAAYDPGSDSWRSMAPHPTPGGHSENLFAAWTGNRLLVFEARVMDPPATPPEQWVAFAYDPGTDRWEELATPPLDPAVWAASSVWTGEEFVLWVTLDHEGLEAPPHGAAYDPETDTWRTLPSSPLGHREEQTATWTGSEMVIWGGRTPDGRRLDDGAAYNPRSNEWRPLADAGIAPRAGHVAEALRGQLVIWGGDTDGGYAADGAMFDPAADSWTSLPGAPVNGRVRAASASGARHLFVWGGERDGELLADGAMFHDRGNHPNQDGATLDPPAGLRTRR